jgi:glucosylceramidase
LEFDTPKNNGEVLIVSTSERGLRFEQTAAKFGNERLKIKDETLFKDARQFSGAFINSVATTVSIDESQKFQEILGFGNAFTGAVSHHLKTIPDIKDHIYKSYFSNTTGLGFSFLRIPIGGCDFDFAPWAYNELPENDVKLSNFTKLDQRDIDRLNQLKDLMKVSGNSDIKIVGAAWR